MNRSLGFLARILCLTVAWVAVHVLVVHLLPGPRTVLPDALAREATNALAQVGFLTAAALAAVAVRTHWHGLRLLGCLVALQLGLGTLVPLLEILAYPALHAALPRARLFTPSCWAGHRVW
jgi:hypothetical protein